MVKVSVVIPAYNQAAFLPAAIESVLAQTMSDWEMWIVDDGSKDATGEVVAGYSDNRIHYLYQANKGLPGARNSGIAQAAGEYIAFLDADDYYHPEKLEQQARHLDLHPEVGLSYASRISVDQAGNTLRLRRAPESVNLGSFIEGFPFTINDLVVRRSWVEKIGAFDESYQLHSEDRNFYLRLLLNGCTFGRVDRALAYRRVHEDRAYENLQERLATMFRALETVFSDPRCPPQILGQRDIAYARDYLVWGYHAAIQCESLLAGEYYAQAIRLNPSLANADYAAVYRFLVLAAIADGTEHAEKTRLAFASLPMSETWIRAYTPRAVARGYLLRGVRDALWGRLAESEGHLSQAARQGYQVEESLLSYWTEELVNYEAEFGAVKGQRALDQICTRLVEAGFVVPARKLKSMIYINQAFQMYRSGRTNGIPAKVLQAVVNDPGHLKNRGVLAMFLRALVGAGTKQVRG